jgi:hypothetical protein
MLMLSMQGSWCLRQSSSSDSERKAVRYVSGVRPIRRQQGQLPQPGRGRLRRDPAGTVPYTCCKMIIFGL